jgi:TatD DNase family protein
MFIDSHSHLYSKEFNNDRGEAICRAVDAGVRKIILPNIDTSSIGSLMELSGKYPDVCFPLMGLHPTSVNESYKKELEIVESYLEKSKFYGIGEIGIDLYWDKTFLKEQEEVFRQQLSWAKNLRLPVVIHVRNSFNEVFSILKEELDGTLTGIFHCFSGRINEAKRIIGFGFKLGIGGVVTYKNSYLPETLKQVDIHHLVLETDSPYLSPVPFRGERNECSYLTFIAQKVAEIYDTSMEEVGKITSENVVNLFGI